MVDLTRAGVESVADFLTKAHPASHCRAVRHLYVAPDVPTPLPTQSAMLLSSGCITPPRASTDNPITYFNLIASETDMTRAHLKYAA